MENENNRMAKTTRRGRPRKAAVAKRPPAKPTRESDHVVVSRRGIICPWCGRGADMFGQRQRTRADGSVVITGDCSACGKRVQRVIAGDRDTVQPVV